MSLTKEKREQVRRYILEKIENNQNEIPKRTAETFNISLNTVYRYQRDLTEEGILVKQGTRYTLKEECYTVFLTRDKNDLAAEDNIYNLYIKKHVQNLPQNIQQIWQYSFMEMMNNAIDHSDAKNVIIVIRKNYMSTTIAIFDNGIGIFRKIKEFCNYQTLDDSVQELFKGKLTTDSKHHSGEGIFFTSRILDQFVVLSDGKLFSHDNYSEVVQDQTDAEVFRQWSLGTGTAILMKISNYSNKTLKEVFDMFTDMDGGFNRTRIPIKNFFDMFPVSRSQAKRLCQRFENFNIVELDFSDIPEIGQGFAHEIFVVFQNDHQNVKLDVINASREVQRMIYHVTKS